MNKKLRKSILFTSTIMLIVAGIFAYTYITHRPTGSLEIYVFALNKGSASLLLTPEGKRILVNGGPNNEIIRHVTRVLPFYSRNIDVLILTDQADKEVFGLIDIIQRYNIRDMYMPAYLDPKPDSNLGTLLATGYDHKVLFHELKTGDMVALASSSTKMKVLFPENPSIFQYSSSSPPQLVFRIEDKDMSILFAGNASKKIQNYIAKNEGDIKADKLYLTNSAGASLLSGSFLEAVQPNIVIFDKKPTNKPPNPKTKNPLDGFSADRLYNIREKGTLKAI